MTGLQHGTTNFFPGVCYRTYINILLVLLATTIAAAPHPYYAFTAGVVPFTANSLLCTNSCTLILGSPTARPTLVDFARTDYDWGQHDGYNEDELCEMGRGGEDDMEPQLARAQRIVKWPECVAHDWPELDLQWCLADWHDGKLIRDSLYVAIYPEALLSYETRRRGDA